MTYAVAANIHTGITIQLWVLKLLCPLSVFSFVFLVKKIEKSPEFWIYNTRTLKTIKTITKKSQKFIVRLTIVF